MDSEKLGIKSVAIEGKQMANGMRNTSGIALSKEEIEYVKTQIKRIEADLKIFVFNDLEHLKDSTCYNFEEDVVYVTRNVFPDEKYASAHPRDTMSVAAVLAHEYYGHRTFRDEYLSDMKKGKNYYTTPLWEDECRASLVAARTTPGLTDIEKRDLVLDAVFRAKEFGQLIKMDDFMKEAVYGYSRKEREFSKQYIKPQFISEESQKGIEANEIYKSNMPKVRRITGY